MKYLITNRRHIYSYLLILAMFSFSLKGKSQLPVISTIVSKVSIDTLISYANDITGERNVIINGVTKKISSRHRNYPWNELAYQYILEKLNSYGLTTDSLLFGTKGKNALAIQPGSVNPNRHYILCAHYDAMPDASIAPGAEDNASGVVSVLEAARILSKYTFEYSIIYALWDEEEQGLLGSKAYAAKAVSNGDKIQGVINLDMVAYDGDGDNLSRIASKNISNSFEISDSVVAVNSDYNIGLNFITKIPLASGNSDQASFWDKGFGAVHIIEDFETDRTPHYHKATDKVSSFTLPYFHKMAKLIIGSIATLAVPVTTTDIDLVDNINLVFAYPNPATNIVSIRSEHDILLNSIINIYSILGEKLITLNGKSGRMEIDVSSLSSGMYILKINTQQGVMTEKLIISKKSFGAY